MACSYCKKEGHNIRTCEEKKINENGFVFTCKIDGLTYKEATTLQKKMWLWKKIHTKGRGVSFVGKMEEQPRRVQKNLEVKNNGSKKPKKK